MRLSILVVTRAEPHAQRFLEDARCVAERLDATLVAACDGAAAMAQVVDWATFNVAVVVASNGCIESVLDDAVAACPDGYVLRLDDDERCSDPMVEWLESKEWLDADHWAFSRAHLYPDDESYATSPPLWPDLQTRLSVKEKSGGRHEVHVGSPHGTGRLAPCALEHHKFLVRSYEERRTIMDGYEAMQSGAGSGFAVFSVPEDFDVTVEPYRVPVPA